MIYVTFLLHTDIPGVPIYNALYAKHGTGILQTVNVWYFNDNNLLVSYCLGETKIAIATTTEILTATTTAYKL